jgi:hypothetical protein
VFRVLLVGLLKRLDLRFGTDRGDELLGRDPLQLESLRQLLG